jgi:hypothetical protein
VLQNGKVTHVPIDSPGAYKQVDPELAARLHAAGEAYTKETGKPPKFGEFSRGEDVQKVYYDAYKSGSGGIAAPPGGSHHQQGTAGDLPAGGFRDWLYAGNKDQYGLHFPVKGDTPHIEINPAYKGETFSGRVPAGTAPAAAPAAATGAPGTPAVAPAAAQSPRLVQQRAPIAAYLDANPAEKDKMAAIMLAEDNKSATGRIGIVEAGANRINAAGKPITSMMDPAYYQPMHDGSGTYETALRRIQAYPELRQQLHAEIDQALKTGTNITNGATDFATGGTAAQAAATSTHTYTDPGSGQQFFIKDSHPETHGAGTVAANQAWKQRTFGDQPPAPAAAPPQKTAATPPAAAPKGATTAAAAPAATPSPAPAPAAPPTPTAPAAAPTPPPTAASTPPASAAPASSAPPPAAAAPPRPAPPAPPAPAPPVAAAPPPPKPTPPLTPAQVKPMSGLDKARAFADRPLIDIVKEVAPDQASKIPAMIGNKTPREISNMPFAGSAFMNQAEPLFGKLGITRGDVEKALAEPPRAPGKRSDVAPSPEGAGLSTELSARSKTGLAPPGLDQAAVPMPKPDPRMEGRNAAQVEMGLTPQERALYDRHVGNLYGQGGVDNPDGSRSTLRTLSFEQDGKTYNVPTVYDGKILPPKEAIDNARAIGLDKFPSYPSEAAAESRYGQMHGYLDKDTAQYMAQRQGQPQQQSSQITPEMAKAIEAAFAPGGQAQAQPMPQNAMPVLPPGEAGSAGVNLPGPSMNLAPPGLEVGPSSSYSPMQMPGSQGSPLALAGVMPQAPEVPFNTGGLNVAQQPFNTGGLSPIPFSDLQGWGWGGGGAGVDVGGFGGFGGFGGGGE